MLKTLAVGMTAVFLSAATTIFPKTALAQGHTPPPPLSAEGAVLMERTTGQILFSKNANQQFYPASTTKVLTALLLAENTEPLDMLITSNEATILEPNSAAIYLLPGEQITAQKALASLLMVSANDAANVIAEHVAGSIEQFAVMMNERAKELGADNSHFTNPSGLHDPGHVSTPIDIARILSKAVENEQVARIFSITGIFPLNRDVEPMFIWSRNDLLFTYDGAYAGKTGWTEHANYTYVGAARRGDLDLVVALMNVPTRDELWADAKTLLNWGFENFEHRQVVQTGQVVGALEVKGGAFNAPLAVAQDVSLAVPKHSDLSLMTVAVLHKDLTAPVEAGAQVGTLHVTAAGEKFSVPLRAGSAIPETPAPPPRWGAYIKFGGCVLAGLAMLRLNAIRIRRVKQMRARRARLRQQQAV